MTPAPQVSTVEPGFKLDRLAAFCDGVIAIAITILVLGLEVPSVHKVPESRLVDYLQNTMLPAFGFVVSFILIGTYWMGHYAIFHYLTHATRVFVVLNGLFLLSLSFLPFPTGLQAAYRNDELALAFYYFANFMCGMSLLSIWLYAARNHRLIRADISPAVVRSMTQRLMYAPLISLAAVGCSFVSMTTSRLIFLTIPFLFLSHHLVDTGWQEPASDDAP
ncbi:MAG: TMEM175 family protein [Planctomycetota bacterium]|nr:TMEM175 family protein [Planctomycetota bacterium]MDA1211560.1 TMEM175 family protein [Planctomycetota bacterium]